MKTHTVEIDGNSLTIKNAEAIALGANVAFAESVKARVDAAQKHVHHVSMQPESVYGVNTGFGYFANKRISGEQLKKLQHNIIVSHASGYGKPLSIPATRLAMALRLNVLIKGHTGVTFELCDLLRQLLEHEIYPIIPEFGSVGASGDLAPLAHLALPLIGEGKVNYRGEIIDATTALENAGLKPIQLREKEGLGLINGTQIMLAVGTLALAKAMRLMKKSHGLTALSYEAARASLTPLNPRIHKARGQLGQITVAEEIFNCLEGSYLFQTTPLRLQDPYSLRCAPQVHGASLDALGYTLQVVLRELNAATDNPLVFPEDEMIVSGGNFHGQPLAIAFDVAAIAMSEMANISERRLELLFNPNTSHLPAFLTPNEGICSGYMAAQYLSASIVNENKLLANPSSTDSIPGNVGIEDHVSMGMTSARKFSKIVDQSAVVLSIEMLASCQAIDLRKVSPLGKGTSPIYQQLRQEVPMLVEDRFIAEDVDKAVNVFNSLEGGF